MPIVLYGWSLGAGVSMAAACNGSDFAGVIAESPYRYADTPARNVLRLRGLPYATTLGPALGLLRVLLGKRIRLDRALWTRDLPPTLVLQGAADEISPTSEARFLADRAGARFVEIQGAGHNNLWTVPEFARESGQAVREFLDAVATRPAATPDARVS